MCNHPTVTALNHMATSIYLLDKISCRVPHNLEEVVIVEIIFRKPKGHILVARWVLAVWLKRRERFRL